MRPLDGGRWLWQALLVLVVVFFGMPRNASLQSDPARDLYRLINQARLEEGLPPLGRSTLLAQAAQRHADDMALNALIDQTGSDGSTYQQRVREAGYRAWNDGLLVNESIWAGLGTAENALNWFRSEPERWAMFTDVVYREVGLGYTSDAQGVNYYVIEFGSRPGVLPIFINDGLETTDSPVVAIRLSNEEAVPLGEVSWIGAAIEVRISETPEFDGVAWQSWEPLLPWALPDATPGEYAVYVEFRDGAGRTTISEDTIRLVTPGESVEATPALPESGDAVAPLPTSTPVEPIPEPTTPVVDEAVVETGAVPALLPTGVPPVDTPALPELTPLPTWTALPDFTPADESQTADWPLLAIVLLQGLAWVLGIALFLKRR